MIRQALHRSRLIASALLVVFCIAHPSLAADPSQPDPVVHDLKLALRGATAVQVLLISHGSHYLTTLSDGQAARGRVHSDGCRYVTEDPAAVSSLLDIVDASLVSAGKAVYAFGQGGGDLRAGILFEKDGVPLNALYMESIPGWMSGVFDDGWMRMKMDVRDRIEEWLALPHVRYVGGRGDDRRPHWRAANGQVPLPCTMAETVMPADVRPTSKNSEVTGYRFQAACEHETGQSALCQCLRRKLPGAFVWINDGWPSYRTTIAQGAYTTEAMPWFPTQKFLETERREIFDAADAARKSCELDSSPPPQGSPLPPVGITQPIGYPPTPPPPPIGVGRQ